MVSVKIETLLSASKERWEAWIVVKMAANKELYNMGYSIVFRIFEQSCL